MLTHSAITVKFPRPVSGAEVVRIVKELIENDDSRSYTFIQRHFIGKAMFHQYHYFDDGDIYVIGQVTPYNDDQFQVSPTRKLDGFRPDRAYRTVVVTASVWPWSEPLFYSNSDPIEVIQHFAERLEHRLAAPVVA